MSSVDFKSLLTWQSINANEASMRISSDETETGCNIGTLSLCIELFKRLPQEGSARFFLNCELLGLRGWRPYFAHKNYCNGDYNQFINCVLKSDQAMMRCVREKEKEMNTPLETKKQ